MEKVNSIALWCVLILLGIGVVTTVLMNNDQERQLAELPDYSKDYESLQHEVVNIVHDSKINDDRYIDPSDVLIDHFAARNKRQVDSLFACMDDQTILNVSYSLLKRCLRDETISRGQIVEEYLNNKQIYDNLPKTDPDYLDIGLHDEHEQLRNNSISDSTNIKL